PSHLTTIQALLLYIVRWFCPRPSRLQEKPLRSFALPSKSRVILRSGAGPCETSAGDRVRLIAAPRFPSPAPYRVNSNPAIGRRRPCACGPGGSSSRASPAHLDVKHGGEAAFVFSIALPPELFAMEFW